MMLSKLSPFQRFTDTLNEKLGYLMSWLVLILVVIICYDVGMRYAFKIGSVALQELEWHLFALIFLLGAPYTLKHDNHVRVDVFFDSRYISDRGRALIDIFGTIFLLFPFCALIIVTSLPFVERSYSIAEGSPDPGGLPYRYLLKATICIAFFLLLLQGLAQLVRAIAVLRNTGKRDVSELRSDD